MIPADFAKAIAIVESGNISNPPMGDDGRARGRYQMHPDFFEEWELKLNIHALLGEQWDSLDTRIVQGYFSFRMGQGLTAVQTAVSYHIGHIVHESDADWDSEYASEFTNAAATLQVS